MKQNARTLIAASALALTLSVASSAQADYPIASHRYLADPGVMVYNGRVYMYCSNDDDNTSSSYLMHSIVAVSSADMKNWTDHGVVFNVPTNASWASRSWAPAVVARNSRFYLYFGNNASGIGVASSTSPTGTFTDARGGYLVSSSTPGASGTNQWLFDPGVFVDGDGQAYLYFGGNGSTNARVVRLNSDMISLGGSVSSMGNVPNFLEASWMHKRNGIYYFSYSTTGSTGQRIDYMTSSGPTSGFVYRGTVAGQPPTNWNNNHHSIFQFNGKWYHAYHNRYVSNQTGSGVDPGYHRNLALEVLNYNADGTIQPIVYTTNGVPQVGTVNPFVRQEAEMFSAQSGIETERSSEGGMNVGYIQNGDWVKVTGVAFGSTGARNFMTRLASAGVGGKVEVRIDSLTNTPIGTCSVAPTGGWQNWVTSSCSVSTTTGTHDVYFKFTGGSGFLFNMNWWQFS